MIFNLDEITNHVKPLNEAAKEAALSRQNSLVKPLGSLGKLEDLAVQLAGISGDWKRRYEKKAIIIMCADNGVYEEGVSSASQEVTLIQSLNFQKGITGVGVLSELAGNDLVVIDIGINSDVTSENFLDRKIRKGTHNLAKQPAMSRDEALRAMQIGFEEVQKLVETGYSVVGTGEMGLGNTTTSSLVLMALTGCSTDDATGRGAGLSNTAFEHKKQVIENALALHKPDRNDPLDILAKVGGFDIAGLVGVYLGAAYHRIPVVIDGVISATAALIAYRLCKTTRDYMIPSHCSEEPGYAIAMTALGISPYFDLGMRLGEGSGCPFTFLLIDAAQNIINDMATFDESAMDESGITDIENGNQFEK